MLIREMMTPNPVTIGPDDTLGYAAEIFKKIGIGIIPVVEKGKHLIGICTSESIIGALITEKNFGEPIKHYIEKEFIAVYEDEELEKFLDLGVQRAPVVDCRGCLVGVITKTDFVRIIYRECQDLYEQLEAVVSSLRDGIIAIDQKGIILRVNNVAKKFLGVSKGELLGHSIFNLVPNLPIGFWLETKQEVRNEKYLLDEQEFLVSFLPLFQSKRVGAVLVFHDIREIEKLSQELQLFKELKEELDAVIESSYDGIYITDGNGVTLRVNKACERIEGITAEDVIGRHMKELEEAGYYSESVTLKVLERKEPVTLIQKVKNGKEIIATGNPVFKDGKIFRVVTNSRDITDLNNLQRQLLETRKLSERYQSELEHLRLQQLKLENIVANSSRMRQVIQLVVQVAEVDTTVLILGESGVGKEVIAKIIHRASKRSKGPFIKINCGAIPENLLESELFGYVKGAFTGASKEGKMGLFELAHKGTIFLDEIAELPLNLQVKLLRVLQEREIYKVGGDKPIPVDVRIIAATNRNLQEMVAQNLFRADLFYRLNVVPVLIPPLRDRRDDIQPLIINFLNQFNKKYNMNKNISSAAIDCLTAYDWPGNVRELENMIERLVVTSHHPTIDVEHLPDFVKETAGKNIVYSVEKGLTLKDAMERFEKEILLRAMKSCRNTQEMAEVLGVDRTTITRKMKRHGINNPF